MAMYKSEDGINYAEIENRMPSSGYIINEDKSYCTVDSKNHDTNAVLKTVDGNHVFNNLAKSDKCYLYFDKYIPTGSDIILENLESSIKMTTPYFGQIATTDEGVYATEDGMYGGTSYYWRGAVTNNYVTFAGKCWRIVRINGDRSIRLIYDGTTCHANGSNSDSIAMTSVAYNSNYNQSNYVGWTYTGTSQRPSSATSGTASNAKAQLESWYSSNIIGTNASKVADGKYCNDRNVASGYTWAIAPNSTFFYAARTRLHTDYAPTLSCSSNDTYTLKVGLISADEVEFAGGKGEDNTSYYLYNGQNYWTMSPYNWDRTNGRAMVFFVQSSGCLNAHGVAYTYDIRPVINLKSDVTFSSGDGTQNNPYIVQ